MPSRSSRAQAVPAAVEEAVTAVGQHIAIARLRRGWRQKDLAEKAGITRATLVGIEQGKLGTGMGAYASVLWALGLHEGIAQLATPDKDIEGMTLEAARLGSRARPSAALDDNF